MANHSAEVNFNGTVNVNDLLTGDKIVINVQLDNPETAKAFVDSMFDRIERIKTERPAIEVNFNSEPPKKIEGDDKSASKAQ